jgi:cell division cycle protein 20 (cofactor of APC complex)
MMSSGPTSRARYVQFLLENIFRCLLNSLLDIFHLFISMLTFLSKTIKQSIADNTAAIKAVAWCPFHPSLLATGAGTADRRIRLFNANTGNCVMQTDTKSQVCAIQWSITDRELISGHGYSDNQLSLWKYPSLVKVSDIMGNEGRTLGLCLSPDGTTVLSASADEILRFWRVFSPENTNKQKKHQQNSCLQRTIR